MAAASFGDAVLESFAPLVGVGHLVIGRAHLERAGGVRDAAERAQQRCNEGLFHRGSPA